MKRHSKAIGKAGKAAGRKGARSKRAIRPKRVPGRRFRITKETEIARLTRERDEALEREKAAAEVLRVISSSSGDLNSVFDLMLENASRICGADFGFMYLYEKTSGGPLRCAVQLEPLTPFRWPLIPAVIESLQAAVGET
jgi:two-component system, NtrC family, sensor kinase